MTSSPTIVFVSSCGVSFGSSGDIEYGGIYCGCIGFGGGRGGIEFVDIDIGVLYLVYRSTEMEFGRPWDSKAMLVFVDLAVAVVYSVDLEEVVAL